MEVFVFSAPIAGAFDVDVGFAFIASVIGFVVAAAPAVLALRSLVAAPGESGLIHGVDALAASGRLERRAA